MEKKSLPPNINPKYAAILMAMETENWFYRKNVLVTGAGQGIGRELVYHLVDVGAIVYALSKDPISLKFLKFTCPEINTIVCDLSDWNATENALADLEAMDHLINNAGVTHRQLLEDATEEVFDATFDVNVKAIINVTKIVTNKMIAEGKTGSIVNISSFTARKPFFGFATYAASKAAVDMITKCMSVELAPHNIRVATVSPTVVLTDTGIHLYKSLLDVFKKYLPLRAFPTAKDCCKAILFLLSDDAKYTTGTGLMVNSVPSIA